MRGLMNDYVRALFEVVTPLVGGMIILMNAAELFFLLKAPKRSRSTMGIVYVINLCLSDLFVGVMMVIMKSMTPFINTTLKGNDIAENVYDIIQYGFIRLSLFVSVINLIVLTLDRVWATSDPFSHRKRTKRFAIKVCGLVWVLSLGCSALVYCISRYHLGDIDRYNSLVFPIVTYTGTVIFIVCYTKIYQTIRTSRLKMGRSNTAKSTSKDNGSEKNNSQEKENNAAEMKFLRLAVKTVGIFVICWTPFSTTRLLRGLGKEFGGRTVYATFFTLAFMNSLLNPFVYFQHMWRVIAKQFVRCTQKKSHLSEMSLSQVTSTSCVE